MTTILEAAREKGWTRPALARACGVSSLAAGEETDHRLMRWLERHEGVVPDPVAPDDGYTDVGGLVRAMAPARSDIAPLSAALGIAIPMVSDWRDGRRRASPGSRARLERHARVILPREDLARLGLETAC